MVDLKGPTQWAEWFVNNNLTVDLGQPGWDSRYGNGLVDVNKVIDLMLKETPANV
jgi:hypothetical protein